MAEHILIRGMAPVKGYSNLDVIDAAPVFTPFSFGNVENIAVG